MNKTYPFLMMLFLFGCGVKRLAVDHADDLLRYQVTRKIPLYSEQKNKLERDLGNFLNASKTKVSEVLPVIDKVSLDRPKEVEQTYPKLEKFYLKLAEDFSNLMASYMAILDSKQQKEMFNELGDENRELLKKEKEDRIDQFEDRFKTFFGEISGPQKQLIRKNADYLQERAKLRLDRRIKLQEKIKAIYNQDISTESRVNYIRDAFKIYQDDSIKDHRNIEIIKDFLPTLSKKQKEHFRQHVEDVKELLKYFLTVDY